MSANAESKGNALCAQAEKKLNSFSFFNKTGNKEDAQELYTKAASQFKIAKAWESAAGAYIKSAELAEQLGSEHEASQNYVDAAKAYKNVDAKKAVKTFEIAVSMHMDNNRFSTAAKLYKQIAELWEEDAQIEKAMAAWTQAADCYQAEDSATSANQCLLKVAGFAAQQENFRKAIEIYEQVSEASLGNNLTKWSVTGYFFKALLCHMAMAARADDVEPVNDAVEKYTDMHPAFERAQECKLIVTLAAAWTDDDIDGFTEAIFKFDQITKLDNWTASILLDVKKALKGEAGAPGVADADDSDDDLDLS